MSSKRPVVNTDSDLSQRAPARLNETQKREVGMPLIASDYDTIEEVNPFTQMESNPAKLHRCVKKVKAKGGAKNPWAVCNASIKG